MRGKKLAGKLMHCRGVSAGLQQLKEGLKEGREPYGAWAVHSCSAGSFWFPPSKLQAPRGSRDAYWIQNPFWCGLKFWRGSFLSVHLFFFSVRGREAIHQWLLGMVMLSRMAAALWGLVEQASVADTRTAPAVSSPRAMEPLFVSQAPGSITWTIQSLAG